MAQRTIGLRGYLGELIVQQWLKKKYPESDGYKIIKEIIPQEYPKKGGGYLDFGIIIEKEVLRIYEVKTQDYIFDGGINGALKYIWENKKRKLLFIDNQNNLSDSSKDFEAFLILLVPPNEKGIKEIKVENLKNVLLFSDLKIEQFIDIEKIKKDTNADLESEIKLIENPKQGTLIKKEFLKCRGQSKDCI